MRLIADYAKAVQERDDLFCQGFRLRFSLTLQFAEVKVPRLIRLFEFNRSSQLARLQELTQ